MSNKGSIIKFIKLKRLNQDIHMIYWNSYFNNILEKIPNKNKKDEFIWSTEGDYMGVFGVNPAVDEFCQKYGYELKLNDYRNKIDNINSDN